MEKPDVHVRLVSSKFACNDLQIAELTGTEHVSRLFHFEVDVVAVDTSDFDPEAALGAEASILFEEGGVEVRRVYGIIAEITDLLEAEPGHAWYRMRLVPRAHRLSLVETQEVFLGMTVPEIIKQKLERAGLGRDHVELRLRGTYDAREFTVQYRESDLDFISRLAENAGMSFFVDHRNGRDILMFTDHNAGFPIVQSTSERLAFHARGDERNVFALHSKRSMFPTKYVVHDYHDQHPKLDLASAFDAASGFGGEVVEYGAFHASPEAGKKLAQIRAEERAALHRYYEGASGRCELEAGATFSLEGSARAEGVKFLAVSVTHRVRQNVMMHGTSEAVRYANTFRAVDAKHPFRPERLAKKPRIHGLLHAITEAAPPGASGRVAQLDEQGRYTVRFFFDMGDPKGRLRSSGSVRMLQPHAGPRYGMHFPLKPDVEVLVAFVDGDPDRPVIAGSVPNPLTPSPVTAKNALLNKIETESGIVIAMKDA